ncbi:uncharacterized protein LOC116417817 [Nasonia vitripennis]|uniref:Uncharacterized protein n=1 Tax=Nasonia vitripennis TaxID=7425 RepID=A0A7M7QJR6_NASVI|nr:uncharacterized protein LOC116417817 [Nasonia vitripennis]
MLGDMEKLSSASKIWIEVGSGNRQRIIDVNKLYEELGNSLCNALPELHAFTGCDFNPAFYQKGKKRSQQLLRQSADFQKVFADLGYLNDNNRSEIFEKIQAFVCHLYGMKKLKCVNEARFVLFSKTYKCSSTVNDSFKIKVKNVDGSSMPPSQSELLQQFLRAAHIANIWRNAHAKIITELSPIDHGWKIVEGKYEFDWFQGDQLPQLVNDVVLQPPEENSDSRSETQSETTDIDVSDHDEINEFDESEEEFDN